jgi:hypothetical protein
LSTLAVPNTWTGELIALLASGLSMMIFRLGSAIGVAAVAGSVALVGAALALGLALTEAEAPALT